MPPRAWTTPASTTIYGTRPGYDTLFFLTLISLITTLHDRWRPVHEVHEVLSRGEPAPVLDVERG
ncbi:MAG TPA: hypothetical protein DEQ43_03995 [Nocardioides bacterium]|uniref:hypothetical protein n=1 Tax=uncultured Nocardioides sp. TaxID=198441 RepID=UPI000EDFFF74|nr:hypothetical protein [uncultured Nocardioides sp.]HCB03408.1 hypothetical protein [Nocardioides sp.]HRD60973.1 hypothetical protein [Nocardioides sp.]